MSRKMFDLWKQHQVRKERRKRRKRKEKIELDKLEKEKLEKYRETRRLKKEREMKIESVEKNIRHTVDIMSFGSTLLLFKGGMAMICLGTSMVSVKLVSMIGSSDKDGTGMKAWISLLFSGAAFCFESRSMELCGGTILFFTHIMVL